MLGSVPIWFRESIARHAQAFDLVSPEPSVPGRRGIWLQQGGMLLWIMGLAPLLAITLYVASTSLARSPILGPEPGTYFFRIGLATSYALPVLVLGGVLVGYAIRERSSGFAFAAGMLFHVGLTAAWLMTAATSLSSSGRLPRRWSTAPR